MNASAALRTDLARQAPRFGANAPLRLLAYGFIYWVVIVAALEPGNIVNMRAAGESPLWGQELLRIVCAGLLGSVTAPAFVHLTRYFPVARPSPRRNGVIHLACAVTVATSLIIIAHVLASGLFDPAHRLTMAGLRDDLAANEMLLVTGLIALSGLAHIALRRSTSPDCGQVPTSDTSLGMEPAQAAAPRQTPGQSLVPIEAVEIRVRGLPKRVPIADIDWIETQGNYLALHVGDAAFLLRETLASFQERLDVDRFVRIHRRTIVAIDRVTAWESAANGDGVVRLSGNQALKVSRLYRKALRERLARGDSATGHRGTTL